MTRHITRIEDWNTVNWDEVDFEHFDRESLTDAAVTQVAEFAKRERSFREVGLHEQRQEVLNNHFKRALINGRDPRSDRLFGEYYQSYQKLIDEHIPYDQPWDLAGIETWSEDDWQQFDMQSVRLRFVPREQAQYDLLLSHLDAHFLIDTTSRTVTRIPVWTRVSWSRVDFDHFDEESLNTDAVSEEDYDEYLAERQRYRELFALRYGHEPEPQASWRERAERLLGPELCDCFDLSPDDPQYLHPESPFITEMVKELEFLERLR